jgi:hypothetical protein
MHCLVWNEPASPGITLMAFTVCDNIVVAAGLVTEHSVEFTRGIAYFGVAVSAFLQVLSGLFQLGCGVSANSDLRAFAKAFSRGSDILDFIIHCVASEA